MSVGRCRWGVLSVFVACLTGPVVAAPRGDPILIGVMGGTTGAYGNIGTQAQQGALLAQDKLMSQGGMLGRPVVVEAVNDNGDGTLAGQLFQKFVSKGAVAIVGSPDNGPVTAQLADRYHILDIGLVDGGGLTVYPNGPDKPPHSWVFQSGANSFAWGAALGNYALKNCPKGLAILHDTTSWGMGGFAAFKLAYEKAGKTIALDRPITENWTTGATAQLAPDLQAAKNSGADCVEVWLSPPDQAAFAQMLRTSGEHLTVLGESDTCSDNTFTNLAGPAADGIVCAFITAELHPNDLYKEFAEAYRKRYNEEPTQSAEVSYQAVMTLAHVIEQAKSTDHAVLRDAFEKLSGVPGIDGPVIFSPTRHASFTEQELTLVKYDAANKKWSKFTSDAFTSHEILMISWLFSALAPSGAKPASTNPMRQSLEMSGRAVMSHLDLRDSRLSRIVGDDPLVKRASGFRFTEGPVWRAQDGILIFSDIPGDRLYSFVPDPDRIEIFRAPSNKTNGNCLDREGRLVSCEHATSRVVRQEPDGRMTTLASHYGGLELNSPNDVVVDSSGRLYFTDPPYGRHAGEGVLLGVGIPREEQQPVRGIYRVDPRDGSIIRLVEDFEEPNGLCLAEQGAVLFVNDTAKMHIRRFEVRDDGVSDGEVWAVLEGDEPGVPDGMKVDAEGNLFCTGPGGLHVFAPNSQILGVIRVPEVTGNFNWGDAERQTLYICATSSLYSCRTLVPGPARV